MSGTIESSNCRRSTSDLVDEWSHDAGLVGKDEHVKGHAGLRSAAEAWESRNPGTKAEAAREVAGALADQLAPDVFEHLGMAALGVGAGVAGSAVMGAYGLYKHAWADAHAKGDNIRDLAHNDAVNVALSQKLAFDPRFGAEEAAKRPGVANNTEKLTRQLNGKDAALVPILQARADEGFCAMDRALDATKGLAGSPQRAAAIQSWMKDNGFEDRMRNDVAFGKGTEYCLWTQSPHPGVDASTEANKVHARQAPAQAFACRG
ncbi:hypothetical protein BH11MYX4_BH11MYX4_27870 [soil metagenome]